MASARRERRRINGVILLDKPSGITSQGAVSRAKHLFHAAKAGHTGTLDPMATGLLPIAFGEATKFSNVLLDAPKTYLATVRLGVTTTTGDLEGDVASTRPVHVEMSALEAVLRDFHGESMQTPPMYSALKHEGKPLYEYARSGVEIPRAKRHITINEIELEAREGADISIRVSCSKGTYIRVLAEDIGKALGCGATLAALRRTGVGPYDVRNAVTLQCLNRLSEAERRTCLLPVDALVSGLPLLQLDAEEASNFLQGRRLMAAATYAQGLVRIYDADRRFLGLAESDGRGAVSPRRLIATEQAAKLEEARV